MYRSILLTMVALMFFIDSTAIAVQEDIRLMYRAVVEVEGAEVLAAPGSSHYATEKLSRDAVVDVYRHDPGGWCLIRPPAGSFSIIPDSSIKKLSPSIGEVIAERTEAWVGTRLGEPNEPLSQVTLKLGEKVSILGKLELETHEGQPDNWYQIAPPAGEFRWIRMAHIKRLSQVRNPEEKGGDSKIRRTNFQTEDPTFEDQSTPSPPTIENETVNRGWRKATDRIRVASRDNIVPASSGGFKTPATDGFSKTDEANSQSLPSNAQQPLITTPSSKPAKTAVSSLVSVDRLTGPVSQQVSLLESSLTTEMLKSPAEWDLESILRQATSIAANSQNQQERTQAKRLVDKIRNCAQIQSGYENAFQSDNSNTDLLQQPQSKILPEQSAIEDIQLGTTYDAYGWLNRLVRDKGRMQPTYVLEDEKGQIIYRISPAPGLNLNRYLKNKVGIIGRRGFDQKLQLKHVTAERVMVLDRIRR
ncbi:MAG: hypothetical protein AAGA30_01845 [Planctomycetota bacterium]